MQNDISQTRQGVVLGFKIRLITQLVVGILIVIIMAATLTSIEVKDSTGRTRKIGTDEMLGLAGGAAVGVAIGTLINYYFFTVIKRWAALAGDEEKE